LAEQVAGVCAANAESVILSPLRAFRPTAVWFRVSRITCTAAKLKV